MNAGATENTSMLRARDEAVPATPDEAAAQFSCATMRMPSMSGTACAARWSACQDRAHHFVGGDLCRACPAGAARAKLLKAQPFTPSRPDGVAVMFGDGRAAQTRMQTPKPHTSHSAQQLAESRARGSAAAARKLGKPKPAATVAQAVVVSPVMPVVAPPVTTQEVEPVQSAAVEAVVETCPRCERGRKPGRRFCDRCVDVARKRLGGGLAREALEAWCAENPVANAHGPVLPKDKPAPCKRCQKSRGRIDHNAGRLKDYCNDCRASTRSQARRVLEREPTVDEILRGLTRPYGAAVTLDLIVATPPVGVDPVEVPVVEVAVEACETIDLPAVTLEQPGNVSLLDGDLVAAAERAWEPEDEPNTPARTLGPVARLCPGLLASWPHGESIGYGDAGLMPAAVDQLRQLRIELGVQVCEVVFRRDGVSPYFLTPGTARQERRLAWDGTATLEAELAP